MNLVDYAEWHENRRETAEDKFNKILNLAVEIEEEGYSLMSSGDGELYLLDKDDNIVLRSDTGSWGRSK
jgi:hypothetical protein